MKPTLLVQLVSKFPRLLGIPLVLKSLSLSQFTIMGRPRLSIIINFDLVPPNIQQVGLLPLTPLALVSDNRMSSEEWICMPEDPPSPKNPAVVVRVLVLPMARVLSGT